VLPVIFSESARVGLIGQGEAFDRRSVALADAGVTAVRLEPTFLNAQLRGLQLLFVAGLDPESSRGIAARARAHGVAVNVEDIPELCDFHMPAVVRRGELLLTVSTGGRAPGLARRLREWLETKFDSEWAARLGLVAEARQEWRKSGAQPHEVSSRTRDLIAREGWLE
jgi:precorrin-2 dehydrogenase/sirohydrochlorin ferrochelatase